MAKNASEYTSDVQKQKPKDGEKRLNTPDVDVPPGSDNVRRMVFDEVRTILTSQIFFGSDHQFRL